MSIHTVNNQLTNKEPENHKAKSSQFNYQVKATFSLTTAITTLIFALTQPQLIVFPFAAFIVENNLNLVNIEVFAYIVMFLYIYFGIILISSILSTILTNLIQHTTQSQKLLKMTRVAIAVTGSFLILNTLISLL